MGGMRNKPALKSRVSSSGGDCEDSVECARGYAH